MEGCPQADGQGPAGASSAPALFGCQVSDAEAACTIDIIRTSDNGRAAGVDITTSGTSESIGNEITSTQEFQL